MSGRLYGKFPDLCRHGEQEMRWWFRRDRLKRDWRDVSEIANFMTEYLAAKFESATSDGVNLRTLRDSASFVVNELVENAVKYCVDGTIEASSSATDRHWTFLISHGSAAETVAGLRSFLERLEESSPEELMIEQVERNFEAGSESGSGLGVISIIADHGAAMGWKIEPADGADYMVHTMAVLPADGG